MRFAALAADFDGTLAHDGVVSAVTVEALEKLKASGRKLLLVTGRELADLQRIFDRLDLFDLCVMENGATLYFPVERREQLLADPPSERFVAACRQRAVAGLSVGRVVAATWESEKAKVLDAIQSLGLELQLIFNKGAIMVLPSGVNKASGLAAALNQLCLSRHNVVGVGDAENDHAFLAACECSVAVANALPSLKERADIVTRHSHGAGVEELIDSLVRDDLAETSRSLRRHDILLGRIPDGGEVRFPVYGRNLLIAGSPGGRRASIASAFVERLLEVSYQVCVVDPEGDYQKLGDAVVLGELKSAPTVDAALAVLEKPDRSVVLNLIGVRLDERPAFLQSLCGRLNNLAASKGRPHWLIVDEAHHLLPSDKRGGVRLAPAIGGLNTALITDHPEHVDRDAIASTDTLIAVGKESAEAARVWGAALRIPTSAANISLDRGHALLWNREAPLRPVRFESADC